MQTPVFLVESLERVSEFFRASFGMDPTSVKLNQQPFPHHFLRLSESVGVILVSTSVLESAVLVSLKGVSVRKLVITVSDPLQIQARALACGGVVLETISDVHGGGFAIEGPEGIVLYLVGQSARIDDYAQVLLQSMAQKKPTKGEDETERAEISSAVANPRPIIHTLSCKIMNISSPDSLSPCPPNMRIPVPFETG
jgi:predicted enzyme related to lactoylglutathione lyase